MKEPIGLIRIFAGSLALLGMLIPFRTAQAEQDVPKLEVGVHLATLHLKEHSETDAGVGARVTYNFTPRFSMEGELNVFPRELTRIPDPCQGSPGPCVKAPTVPSFTDRRVEGLFGVKAGLRSKYAGIFGKLRPGFIHFSNSLQVVCVAAPCPPLASQSTEFALDMGGVVEFYPLRRVALRLDVGDTYIRGTGAEAIPLAGRLGHSFQFNAGAALRF